MKKEKCATRLKYALELRNIRQSELSAKTKIPKSAICQYLSGNFEPKQDRVEVIANALDVSEAWLMGFDVPMERANSATNKSVPVTPDDLAENMIVYHRDGKTSEVKLSPKKMDLLIQMIEEFKENNNPNL